MRTLLYGSLLTTLLGGLAVAQPALHLKTRQISTIGSGPVEEISNPRLYGRGHLIVQFDQQPSAAQVAELKARGISVLEDVPDNGLLISLDRITKVGDLGIHYASALEAADKISPLITSGKPAAASGFFLVEFHPDVDMNAARALILGLGIELRDNPDLASHHLLIHPQGNVQSAVAQLASSDEVAYIFPASQELINGTPVRACEGALTTNGNTGGFTPTYGPGWDGPGLGSATVNYVFSKMTAQLPSAAAQAEIERAMAQWAAIVAVTWKQGTNATGNNTVNILWATYDHGDGFPFDGPGGILAHTFYPAPPNPEPIAGDMHFDDSESWHIGSNTDLFSVALHELGHSLGLGHSDDPTAVMYPYYKMVAQLSDEDAATVLTMYAPANSSSAPPAPAPVTPPSSNSPKTPVPPGTSPSAIPLVLNVNAPPSSTTASSVNLSGSASGGSVAIAITWSNGHGNSGAAAGTPSAWTISSVPLAVGSNTITITATSGNAVVSKSVTITRQSASTPPTSTPPAANPPAANPPAANPPAVNPPTTKPTDTTPPSISVTSPSSSMLSTSLASVVISGTASDNVGVTSVYWSTNFGSSGVATGTTNWSFTAPVLVGNTTITINARDAAGNISWRTVMVNRK